jgi:S1-C subfamily serine protease
MRAGIASEAVHIGATASLGVRTAPALDVPGAPRISAALITHVAAGSPAAALGLKVGDEIISVDGVPVCSALDLARLLQRYRPGDAVRVGWLDAFGNARSGAVSLAAGPPA